MFQPFHVAQRVPVSESLTQLHRDQLQKFAQYLIAEMPKEVILKFLIHLKWHSMSLMKIVKLFIIL